MHQPSSLKLHGWCWNEKRIERAPKGHIVLVPPLEFLTSYWNKQKTGRATQHNAHISLPWNTQNHEFMLNKLVFVYELLDISRYTMGDDIVKPNFHVMDPQPNTFVPKRWRWRCTWGLQPTCRVLPRRYGNVVEWDEAWHLIECVQVTSYHMSPPNISLYSLWNLQTNLETYMLAPISHCPTSIHVHR